MSTNWFLQRETSRYGPFSWEQFMEYAQAGRIAKDDLVISEQMEQWVKAADVPGLFISAPPPAPPLSPPPPFSPPSPASGAAARQSMSSTDMKYAGVGIRLVALIMDSIVFFLMGFVMALITGDTTAAGYEMQGAPAFVLFFLGIIYFPLMEGLVGATLGKMAVGLTVRRQDGRLCGIVPALVRNVLRCIDFLPFFYLLGAILIWASPQRKRLGDRVAGTVVVKKSSLPAA